MLLWETLVAWKGDHAKHLGLHVTMGRATSGYMLSLEYLLRELTIYSHLMNGFDVD